MNKYQVKWSKKLVGKKVYTCSVAHSSVSHFQLADSRWTSQNPVLCEAVVISVAGKHVVVRPSNFAVMEEMDSDHLVSSRELWYTSPRAAVLARLKEIYECIAKSVRPDRVDRIFCEKVFDGDEEEETIGTLEFKAKKLDGRRDPVSVISRHANNVYSYEEPLKFAQWMERFKHYPCDYVCHDVICWLANDWNSISYEDGCHIKEFDPLTVFTISRADFQKSVEEIKSWCGEDVTECFEKIDGGKYKVKFLSVYQFLKAKGRIKPPVITKEFLRSVSMKQGSR